MSCIAEKTCADCGVVHTMRLKPDSYNDKMTEIGCWGPCLCGLFQCKHCGGHLQTPQWKMDEILESLKRQSFPIDRWGLVKYFKEDYQI